MTAIRYREAEVQLLARLMRAEAEGEGSYGMLLVGNVGVNRVRADCLDFDNINTITKMIYQQPGGFEAVQRPYFYQSARSKEIRLARQVIAGKRYDPASYALWFFRPPGGNCPGQWFNQQQSGQFKNHCFYQPAPQDCPSVY